MAKKKLTPETLRYVCDMCMIAIRKKDPDLVPQMHPFVRGVALNERDTFEEAYYILAAASTNARKNLHEAEGDVNRALGMMRVYGVEPSVDKESEDLLSFLSATPDGKPS
jgi:hypothetical protein